MTDKASLYDRLGGYDALTAFCNDLLPRLESDPQLGRFWQHRGNDGIAREKQLLIDYLAHKTGGPVYYTGRDMKLSHVGMNISNEDWDIFLEHAVATMNNLGIPPTEQGEIAAFVGSIKTDIVEL
ncbi:group 1 truncated hemoglobin [Alteromonadaceae bacterium M269]|nr:group 1 truncated hemoglobin [Alteromonadaceae bacterium M269]